MGGALAITQNWVIKNKQLAQCQLTRPLQHGLATQDLHQYQYMMSNIRVLSCAIIALFQYCSTCIIAIPVHILFSKCPIHVFNAITMASLLSLCFAGKFRKLNEKINPPLRLLRLYGRTHEKGDYKDPFDGFRIHSEMDVQDRCLDEYKEDSLHQKIRTRNPEITRLEARFREDIERDTYPSYDAQKA